MLGYATFRFSFRSKMPGYEGKPVLIQGISCFRFENGMIAEYREVFDTGIALAQLGFPAERLKRVLDKEAAAQNGSSAARAHLDRFRNLESFRFWRSAALYGGHAHHLESSTLCRLGAEFASLIHASL